MSGRLVLVRHGQSHGNVERRLDTRPPGAALTPLGRDQARAFARGAGRPVLLAHSVATRASQTAAVIGAELGVAAVVIDGIHEVQVGHLENRNDDAAVAEFREVYRRWHLGELDVSLPGGETGHDVLGRYLPALTELRSRYLDDDTGGDIVVVSHGAAIRLASAVLAGVDGGFALDNHLDNTESVVLTPTAGGRWSCARWGSVAPPLSAEVSRTTTGSGGPGGPGGHVADAVRPAADPMG